eukprot:TRINITY_DN13511_c0_g1_i2.p2 TRINITY_DN13511_c0_g1~~TRINITY_DN13511_c0_g1_i2.p2  ORF type:complete len:128 (+),score=31.67 TRINITY_DN13511_c0_g1_i2:179-562(+)
MCIRDSINAEYMGIQHMEVKMEMDDSLQIEGNLPSAEITMDTSQSQLPAPEMHVSVSNSETEKTEIKVESAVIPPSMEFFAPTVEVQMDMPADPQLEPDPNSEPEPEPDTRDEPEESEEIPQSRMEF